MPIEFRCTECGKLLRVADGSVGRQAKCPACGMIVTVTESSAFEPSSADMGHDPFAQDDSANPYQAPADLTTGAAIKGAAPSSSPSVIRPTCIDFGDVFSHTWKIFTEQWGMCLAVGVACLGINLVVGQFMQIVNNVVIFTVGPAGILVAFLLMICTQVFATWLNIGQMIFFIKTARGQAAEFTDLFAGGPYLLRIIGAGILLVLGAAAILGICVLPAGVLLLAVGEQAAVIALIFGFVVGFVGTMVLMLTFFPYSYLIIDQNMGIIDSLSEAMKITPGNKLTMFGIMFIAGIVGALIILCTCFLGIFVVIPFIMLLYPVMYLLMIGQPTADMMNRGEVSRA